MTTYYKKYNLALAIFLNIITFGIYGIVIFSKITKNINEFLSDDQKENNMLYVFAWMLGVITFGIYEVIWVWQITRRLEKHAYRYGIDMYFNTAFATLMSIAFTPYTLIIDYNQFVEAMEQGIEPHPYYDTRVEVEYYKRSLYSGAYGGGSDDINGGTTALGGVIRVIGGSCAGYNVKIKSGEVVNVGKDPSLCQLVIDSKYTSVSRKHLSVSYDAVENLYIVTDYSSNGTSVVGGAKLPRGQATYHQPGTTICLAKTDNTFTLG